jgi:hypothetical protein
VILTLIKLGRGNIVKEKNSGKAITLIFSIPKLIQQSPAIISQHEKYKIKNSPASLPTQKSIIPGKNRMKPYHVGSDDSEKKRSFFSHNRYKTINGIKTP